MAPGPDQIDEHHHVAAGLIGEEVKAEIAVEDEHRERRGQDREGGDDQQVGGQRGPAEYRHAHSSSCPGARILRMVVTKLMPVSKVPTPEICNAHR